MSGNWNPWKITAIAMALIMAAALVIGLVVANWVGNDEKATAGAQAPSAPALGTRTESAPAVGATQTSTVPPQAVVDACKRYVASQTGNRDKTAEVVKDAGGGTLYGLNENKKHDERYREAYAGCMRSRGYSW